MDPIISMKRPIINMETPLGEVPEYWFQCIEPKIVRQGFGGCWIWTGKMLMTGAPMVRHPETGLVVSCRRFIMKMFYDFPDRNPTVWVVGECENRNCVNPNHLTLTTQHPRFYSYHK